jgi:hypothetical protein
MGINAMISSSGHLQALSTKPPSVTMSLAFPVLTLDGVNSIGMC